ncbi:DegT/DnrJ/EryC1/StrS family aminotransferase [Dictyobacter kobayashii]|nr:DegT/DnrJ/EryC1/StrS family aminotransferase [Dictyobacter kobayashii]
MSELHAIVGRVQLKRIEEFISWRAQVAEKYTQLLADCPWATPVLPMYKSSWYKYAIILHEEINRDVIKASMLADEVHLGGEIYDRPLHKQPVLAQYYQGQSFPKAEDICARHICLPIYYGMREDEVEFVIKSLNQAFRKVGSLKR